MIHVPTMDSIVSGNSNNAFRGAAEGVSERMETSRWNYYYFFVLFTALTD